MKKIITLFTIVTLSSGAAAQAQQSVQVGAKAGLSMAVLDGTLNQGASYKPGLHLGAFLRWRPSTRFALQPELVYSMQGAKNSIPDGSRDLISKTRLSYLNLPILAKVYIGKVVNVQFGPQVGMLLSGRLKGDLGYDMASDGTLYLVTDDIDVKKRYKGDFGLCGGVGVDLPNGLILAARLNYGLTDITKDKDEKRLRDYYGIGGLHNRVLEFSVGYAFGGR